MEKEESEDNAVEEVAFCCLPFCVAATLFSLHTTTTMTRSPLLTTSLPSLSCNSTPISKPTYHPPLSPPSHSLPNSHLNSQHPRLPRRQKRSEPAEQAEHDKTRDHDRLQKPETPLGEDIQSPTIFSSSASSGRVVVERGGDLERSARE